MVPLVVVAAAAEAEPPGHELHVAAHADDEVGCPLHWYNLVGLKLIGVAAVPHDEPSDAQGMPGFGLFYERSLIRGWLELEVSLNALVMARGDGAVLPIDVVFKKPFHVSHVIDPFVGVGGVVAFGVGGESFVAPGLIATTGFYVWARNRIGVVVEADYAASYEPHGWLHEVELTTGPIWRF